MHKNLGSGLLENVYEVILAKLLAQQNFGAAIIMDGVERIVNNL